MHGLLTLLPPRNLLADTALSITCTELNTAQVTKFNKLFQLLKSILLSMILFYKNIMLMKPCENVNIDVSKDWPIPLISS